MTEDRDRIARDLHDTVIQRLFAVGLSLQGTARLVDRPEVAGRIGDAIIKLDETIRHLRTAIFNLEMTINQDGFRRMVFDLLHELTPVIGAVPHVTFTGLVDSAVSGSIADHSPGHPARGADQRGPARRRPPGSRSPSRRRTTCAWWWSTMGAAWPTPGSTAAG